MTLAQSGFNTKPCVTTCIHLVHNAGNEHYFLLKKRKKEMIYIYSNTVARGKKGAPWIFHLSKHYTRFSSHPWEGRMYKLQICVTLSETWLLDLNFIKKILFCLIPLNIEYFLHVWTLKYSTGLIWYILLVWLSYFIKWTN